jgi:lipid-binding SYLF domain-containing protein
MFESSIHYATKSALNRIQANHSNLKDELEKAYAYIVFPSVGRASAVLGAAYGQGEVFENKKPVGFATLSQITIGVQLGGQTFSAFMIFNKREVFEDFKHRGRVGFTASATASFLGAAITGTTNLDGVVTHAFSTGGMLLEGAIGGSKIMFIPPQEKLSELDKIVEDKQGEKTKEESSDGQVNLKDILSGSLGPELLEKLASRPIVGKVLSSIRHLSPILPKKSGASAAIMKVANGVSAVKNEREIGDLLHKEALAALATIRERTPEIEEELKNSYGYAIFPIVKSASLVVGGAVGKGEVFEQKKQVGYAQLIQVTIGVQLGGETFSELVFFSDNKALNNFKQGKISFIGDAAAVIIKAGVEATTKYNGLKTFVFTEGGLLIKAALGGQKIVFKPAFLTKDKTDEQEYGQKKKEATSEPDKQEPDKQESNTMKQGMKIGRFNVEEE